MSQTSLEGTAIVSFKDALSRAAVKYESAKSDAAKNDRCTAYGSDGDALTAHGARVVRRPDYLTVKKVQIAAKF